MIHHYIYPTRSNHKIRIDFYVPHETTTENWVIPNEVFHMQCWYAITLTQELLTKPFVVLAIPDVPGQSNTTLPCRNTNNKVLSHWSLKDLPDDTVTKFKNTCILDCNTCQIQPLYQEHSLVQTKYNKSWWCNNIMTLYKCWYPM